ncbi:MAG: hypothetical protein CMH49_02465 [Myxococcales bacterium]|nr:hypothetical protein [Myxococcales bacterium]
MNRSYRSQFKESGMSNLKLKIMSDLHFEYHSDAGHNWINQLDPSGVDILILAGDIAEVYEDGLKKALVQFCELYPEVIFVPGNHEYYRSSITEAEQVFRELRIIPNLHILTRKTVVIKEQRFVGATLWFTKRDQPDQQMWQLRLNDFHKIRGGFESWVYNEAQKDAQYLNDEIQIGDVVVTHHIPSARGVAPRWQDSIEGFGRFFVHSLPEALITKAQLWCHGHGHDSVRSDRLNHTLLANPFGYLNHEENPNFDAKLIFETKLFSS